MDDNISKVQALPTYEDEILESFLKYFGNNKKGRLNEFLVQSRENSWNGVSSLSNYKLLNLITEIAKGLSHLHQRNIIHGNIRGNATIKSYF